MRRPSAGRLAALPLAAALAHVLAPGSALAQPPTPAAREPAVLACVSLANLRALLRRAGGDAGAALAALGDPKADPLGCAALDRGRAAGFADHITLGGQAYDCVALEGSSVCQWVVAGSVAAGAPAPRRSEREAGAREAPGRGAPDKGRR